jgi:hypothetical protein
VGVDYADPAHRAAPWRVALAGTPWVSQRAALRPLTTERAHYLLAERLQEETSSAPRPVLKRRKTRS